MNWGWVPGSGGARQENKRQCSQKKLFSGRETVNLGESEWGKPANCKKNEDRAVNGVRGQGVGKERGFRGGKKSRGWCTVFKARRRKKKTKFPIPDENRGKKKGKSMCLGDD